MSFPGIVAANVYGVTISGADGRAGMAESVCDGPINLRAFRDHLARHLPRCAHPMLLRIRAEISATPTFKPMRQQSAFDPDSCRDPLYLLTPQERAYVRLDRPLYELLIEGKLRL